MSRICRVEPFTHSGRGAFGGVDHANDTDPGDSVEHAEHGA